MLIHFNSYLLYHNINYSKNRIYYNFRFTSYNPLIDYIYEKNILFSFSFNIHSVYYVYLIVNSDGILDKFNICNYPVLYNDVKLNIETYKNLIYTIKTLTLI